MRPPERGDLAWIDFDPQSGREQAGRRPALFLTPAAYNQPSGLALVCPITSRVKGYPYEVALPKGARVQGVILWDHVTSVDWRARRAEFIAVVPSPILTEVTALVQELIGGMD